MALLRNSLLAVVLVLVTSCVWAQDELYLSVTSEPSELTIHVGETMHFFADVDGGENPTVFWDFGEGEVTGPTASYTFNVVDSFLIVAWAEDDEGLSSEDYYFIVFAVPPFSSDLNVEIISPQEERLVLAVGEVVHFEASSGDDDVERFIWQFGDTNLLFEEQSFDWAVSEAFAGQYLDVRLNAIGPQGQAQTYWSTVGIYVHEGNLPPQSTITQPVLDADRTFRMSLGESVTLSGTGTDPDGDLPLSFFWAIAPPEGEPLYIEEQNYSFTPSQAGEHYLSFTAIDSQDEPDPFSDGMMLLVKDGNQIPEAYIYNGSRVLEIDEVIELEAEGHDPDYDVLSYSWDMGDGSSRSGQIVQVSYTQKGVYQVALTADDGDGGISTPYQIYLFVNDPQDFDRNQDPQASIEFPSYGQAFPHNQEINFVGFGYDPDDTVSLYWDFGDGQLGQGSTITKRYARPSSNENELGHYEVRLFARDSHGLTRPEPDHAPIVVYEGDPPPDGEIKRPIPPPPDEDDIDFDEISPIIMRPGETLTFEGGVRGSDDSTGYTGLWLYCDENDEEVFLDGLQVDIPFEDLRPDDWNSIYFILIEEATGKWDPVPGEVFVWARESNVPPEHVFIQEPGFDDYLLVGEGVDLAADSYDDEHDPITYNWTVTLLGPNGSTRSYTGERVDHVVFEAPGLYSISLTGTDCQASMPDNPCGTTAAEENFYMSVLTEEQYETEHGNFPEAQGVFPTDKRILVPAKTRLNFEVEGFSPAGREISGYRWDFGGTQTYDDRAEVRGVSFDKPGYHLGKVSVQDSAGLWSPPDYWEIYVYGDNLPPTAEITQPPLVEHEYDELRHAVYVLAGESVSFSARGEDPDGTSPPTAEWFLDYEFQHEASGDNNPSFTFHEPGIHTVLLHMLDEDEESDPFGDYRIVFVVDPSQTPETYLIEPAGDIVIAPGDELYFFTFGEDPNDLDPLLQMEWDFGTAQVPPGPLGTDVYPVVFNTASPEGTPYEVTVTAKAVLTINGQVTELRDPTPARILITVRQFEDSEFEPNNQFSEAAILQPGNYTNLTLLGGEDDADFYRLDVTRPGKDLRLKLDAQLGADTLSLQFYRLLDGEWHAWQAGNVAVEEGRGIVSLENVPIGSYAAEIRLSPAASKAKRGVSYSFGLNTLEPVLYLPFMVEDGNLSSTVGIINATGEIADIAIQGLDAQGIPVSCKSMELAANGRAFISGVKLFGKMAGLDVARNIVWLKVSSTHRLLGYTNAQSLDQKQLFSVGAVRSLSSAALIPHIASKTDTWYTRAVMVNVDSNGQAVVFESPSGTMPINNALKDGQQVDFRFTDLFGESALPEWGRFKNSNNAASLAGFEIFGRVDGAQQVAGLEMIDLRDKNPNFTQVNGNLYFTHIANTAVFWTGLSLINMESNTQAIYNILAFNTQGQEVARMSGLSLEVGAKLLTTSALLFPDRTDITWLAVETNFEMAGFELFGDYDGKILAGFKATRSLTDTLYFPHLEQKDGESYTGIALLNVSSQSVNLEITLFADDGSVVLQKQDPLAAGQKLVSLIQQIFPEGFPSNGSYLRVRAQGGERVLSGFEIFGTLDPNPAIAWGALLGGLPALKD